MIKLMKSGYPTLSMLQELIDINKEVIIILIKDRKNRKNFERKD